LNREFHTEKKKKQGKGDLARGKAGNLVPVKRGPFRTILWEGLLTEKKKRGKLKQIGRSKKEKRVLRQISGEGKETHPRKVHKSY